MSIRTGSLLLATLLTASLPGIGSATESGMFEVSVDHARVIKIDKVAETIIIGNPSIVDVTVHDAETLVLTGRSYGITNLIVIGRDGEAIIDEEVSVRSFEKGSVRIFRQASRTTYACAPECEPTVTIGDNPYSFTSAAEQYDVRQGMAAGTK